MNRVKGNERALPERIAIHIGAHKTATTHLQKSFYRSADRLAAYGVTFLGPRDLRDGVFPIPEVMRWAGDDAALAEQVKTQLRAICAGRPTLVMSEENLPGVVQTLDMPRKGIFYPNADARLPRLLRAIGQPVELCLGVRDPARFLASAYTQRLMGGNLGLFADYIGTCDPARMRWSDYAARLVALPNVARLTVWRHEDYAALGPAILGRLAGKGGAGVELLDKVIHAGLSDAACMDIANAIRDGRVGEPGIVQAAKRAFPKGEAFAGFDPWDDATAEASRAAYAADMTVLAGLPRVDLLRPGSA